MMELKRSGTRYAIEFYSDEYHNIISAISDAMKAIIGDSKEEI